MIEIKYYLNGNLVASKIFDDIEEAEAQLTIDDTELDFYGSANCGFDKFGIVE